MRKQIYLTALLMISACASPEETQRREQQFTDDIAAIGQDAQTGYFTCLYDSKLWECRQAIWDKSPKPHMPGHEQREFLRRYLDAAERQGATHVLKAEHLPCDQMRGLDQSLWHEGQYAECSEGQRYRILRENGGWRVTPQGGA